MSCVIVSGSDNEVAKRVDCFLSFVSPFFQASGKIEKVNE